MDDKAETIIKLRTYIFNYNKTWLTDERLGRLIWRWREGSGGWGEFEKGSGGGIIGSSTHFVLLAAVGEERKDW